MYSYIWNIYRIFAVLSNDLFMQFYNSRAKLIKNNYNINLISILFNR